VAKEGIATNIGAKNIEAKKSRAVVSAVRPVLPPTPTPAADSTKVGREDFVSFAPISSVDTLITDAEISDADRRTLTDEGVEVITTGATQE
jgi:DeoR family fructose operon transcriptional repressor